MNARPCDLNCDLGESPDDVQSGAQAALLPFVTRASVACGGHAGDDETMATTVEQCLRHGVLIGAHPSYPDRAGFGRTTLAMPPDALRASLVEQVARLDTIVRARGARLAHLKPHGALYHDAWRSPEVAHVVIDVARQFGGLPVIAFPRAATARLFRAAGLVLLEEGFADRAYEPDGSLRPRDKPGAVLDDPGRAADQAERLLREGRVHTLCVHSDSPAARAILAAVHERLQKPRRLDTA